MNIYAYVQIILICNPAQRKLYQFIQFQLRKPLWVRKSSNKQTTYNIKQVATFTHCQHYVLSIQKKYVPDTLTFSELQNPICALMFILTQPEVSAVDPLDIIKENNIRLTVLTDKTISQYLIQNWKNSSPQNWNCPSRDIVSLNKLNSTLTK